MPFGFEEESRKSIKSNVKIEVYKRAKGCCECCAMPLEKAHGDFHHWRSPTISPTAKTVQFLCPTCHRKYGHTRKVITHHSILGDEKEIVTKRHKVKRRKKVTKKKPTTTKKTPKRKTAKKKSTKKPKRKVKKTTKKKTTKRKTAKSKKSTKKKTTSKKKTKRRRKKSDDFSFW